MLMSSQAHELQLLKLVCLEPVLRKQRSLQSEKPLHCKDQLPLTSTRGSPRSNEDPVQPKVK